MGNTCFRPCYKTTVKEDDGFQEVAINSKQAKYVEKEIPDNLTKKGLAAYIPEISSGRVIDVYDGDTFTIAGRVAYNPSLFKFSVRIRGIDTPEKRTKDDNEKFVALKAQAFVENIILGNMVELHGVATDKYGRLLADVTCKGRNIADELIAKRMAVAYDGGTKKCPDNWKTFFEGS